MKKIILILAIAATGFLHKGYAQCTVTNLAVELITATDVPGGCEVVFNFSWEQEVNQGNKFAYVHLWRTDLYPDLMGNGTAYTHTSDFPNVPDLANSLATIVIDGNGTATPVIGTEYHPVPAIPVLSTGLTIHKENVNPVRERMTVKNIRLILPTCTGTGITGDIWASQAENGKNVHCVSAGVTMVVGNPRVTGFMFCQLPRTYSVSISNVGDAPLTLTYNVFIDEGDGYYEPTTHDLKITSTPYGPFNLVPGATYQSGVLTYLPYSNIKPYADHGLWVEVSESGTTHKTVYFISNTCIPLPVSYISFTARREEALVKLEWETASEQNCEGFEVQRRVAGGDFVNAGFVPSQAVDGNSDAPLKYTFSDNNSSKSMSEYRLLQRDFNRSSRYSESRFVRGMEQEPGILVFPNPTVNGQVTVLFAEIRSKKDISLFDNSGRLVRQWRAFTGSDIQVSNLMPGFYLIQVVPDDTRAPVTKKFEVIN